MKQQTKNGNPQFDKTILCLTNSIRKIRIPQDEKGKDRFSAVVEPKSETNSNSIPISQFNLIPNPNPNPQIRRGSMSDEEPRSPVSPRSPRGANFRRRRKSLAELWFRDQQLKHATHKMHLNSGNPNKTAAVGVEDGFEEVPFSLLTDETLSLILSKLPISQHPSNALVCKRWCSIQGRLVRSISLLDWEFLDSSRLTSRFPNLTEVNLVRSCFRNDWNSGIMLSHRLVSIRVDPQFVQDGGLIGGSALLDSGAIDEGLKVLASGCPNLRKLALVNPSGRGLGFVAEECATLMELELHRCDDMLLRGLSMFKNLQILKLVGSLDGLYESVVSDIGLTIIAQGCRRLLKLELIGCEGSYDGIKAIGRCCQMLEELTICNHRMDGGWLSALSYCENLKTLKLQSCNDIDSSPGADEHIGYCPALEELYLERCRLQDKKSLRSLFLVCESARLISLQDCWGLDDDLFLSAGLLRRVNSLSLNGCSLLTVEGLSSVITFWKELETLEVVSCNYLKPGETTPALASLLSNLKVLKWRSDSKSVLLSNLDGTGLLNKGAKFFNRA